MMRCGFSAVGAGISTVSTGQPSVRRGVEVAVTVVDSEGAVVKFG